MKKLLPLIFLVFGFSVNAFATTYYAKSSGGSGAASCVDDTTNVCTLQRAIDVIPAGTHTIEFFCNSGVACSTDTGTAWIFDGGETGENITIQARTGHTPTLGSNGAETDEIMEIAASMVSGSVTLNGMTLADGGTDDVFDNKAPEVNLSIVNCTFTNTDATAGNGVRFSQDTTNNIELITGSDSTTSLRTGATTNVKIAQKITVGASDITVNVASLSLARVGAFDKQDAEAITVTLETDTAGAPSGTPVTNGTSTALDPYLLNTTSEWVNFSFASNVTLTAATVYWVVLQGTYTVSTVDNIKWDVDTTAGAYAGGDGATYNGTSWTVAADNDYMFSIYRKHTRDLTITGSTFTTRIANVTVAGVDDITIDDNYLESTDNVGSTNNIAVTSNIVGGDPGNSVVISNNEFVNVSPTGYMFGNSRTAEKKYIDKLVMKGNFGSVNGIFQIDQYVKKVLFLNNGTKANPLNVTETGNNPWQFGYEVDGTGAEPTATHSFDQIIIEGNYLTYPSSSNHKLLIGFGANYGVFFDNTIVGAGTTDTGAWGIVTKGNYWLIGYTKFYGVSPAIYLSGTNHSRVIFNTLNCYTSGTDGCIYVSTHQDNIYGTEQGKKGIPFYNYITNNVFIQKSPTIAMEHGSATTTLGVGRGSDSWSNRIENNIYRAPSNTNQIQITDGSDTENVTIAEGISTLQSTWQSATYTAEDSLSNYNDQNSYFANPLAGSPANGNFIVTSPAKGNGSVDYADIGGYQRRESSSGGFRR